MKRTSEYFNLKYLVQCKSNSRPCFETIAAFDVDIIARKYATDCVAGAASTITYRVMERTGRGKFRQL